jgi:hypothetical protein
MRSPVTVTVFPRRPIAAAGLLSLIALTALLAAPSRAPAASHASPSCVGAGTHSTHPARACTHRSRRGRSHPRRTGAGRTRLHAGTLPHAGRGTRSTQARSAPLAVSCANGSAPLLDAEETFYCQDGSEPGCKQGASVTMSSDGSTLLCEASGPARFDSSAPCTPSACEDAGEPNCEDASAAAPSGASASACPADGSGDEEPQADGEAFGN